MAAACPEVGDLGRDRERALSGCGAGSDRVRLGGRLALGPHQDGAARLAVLGDPLRPDRVPGLVDARCGEVSLRLAQVGNLDRDLEPPAEGRLALVTGVRGALSGAGQRDAHGQRDLECRRLELDWLYRGVGRFFPEAWARFRDFAGLTDSYLLPTDSRPTISGLLRAYSQMMEDPDLEVRSRADLIIIEDSGHTGSATMTDQMHAAADRLYEHITNPG
jgi:hypothetical protein